MLKIILSFVLLTISQWAFADSFMFNPGVTKYDYDFGEVKCVVTSRVAEKRKGNYPNYTFECFKAKKSLFKKNLGASLVFSSPGAKYFVGLSNSGFHKNAFWILDAKGNLVAAEKHNKKERVIPYCQRSVTIRRQWFDSQDPQVVIDQSTDGKLKSVKVNDCKGNQFDLISLKKNNQ